MPPPREDEQSIKARGRQLYQDGRPPEEEPAPALEGRRRRKPFAVYLAEAPAMRLPPATRAILFGAGVVVVGLLGASIVTAIAERSEGPAAPAELGGVKSGVVTWFKADALAGLADGAAICSWPDSSGRENHAKAGKPGACPTYATVAVGGKSAVRFDAGRNTQLIFNRPVQDDFTILVVFRSTKGEGNGAGWWDGAGLVDGEVGGDVEDFGTSLAADGRVLAGTGKPDTQRISKPGQADGKPHLIGFTRMKASGTITLYVDGEAIGGNPAGTASLTAPSRLVIGSLQENRLYYTGDIAEVILYDRVLSDADRQAVEGALRGKYRIGKTQ